MPTEVRVNSNARMVKNADKAAIVAARLFDQFAGAGVPEGMKSLAVEVSLQPVDKSYAEADLAAISAAIVAAAMGSYRAAFSLVVVAIGAFILRALVSLFFGTDFAGLDI